MFYLKKFDDNISLANLISEVFHKTKPMPQKFSRFSKGFYSKSTNNILNLFYDSGEGMYSKGIPIEIHFYAVILFKTKTPILIGFLSPNISMYVELLLILLIAFVKGDILICFLGLFFVSVVWFLLRNDYSILKEFVDNLLQKSKKGD